MLRSLWYHLLSRALVRLHYRRVQLFPATELPAAGPVLYVGLHRNGAVDGYVYKTVLPRARFMVSVQLRRSLLGRIFFDGIEVSRQKDSDPGRGAAGHSNAEAIAAGAEHVANGGAFFIMPEGTSDLGHRHLPFQKGAARLLAAVLERGGAAPVVVPVGIHYERAWAWQSDVEVVSGPPIDTTLPAGLAPAAAVRLLHERIVAALEALAVEAESAERFARREAIAYAATLGSRRSYISALKALEAGLPEIEAEWLAADAAATARRLWRHQGVPLVPMGWRWAYPLLFCLLLPPTLLAGLFNAVPILGAWLAGRRLADGRNTIALWRLLVGLPLLVLWSGGWLVAALASGHLAAWLAYALVSVVGLASLRRVKKLAVSLHNWIAAPDFRPRLIAWRESLEATLQARGI